MWVSWRSQSAAPRRRALYNNAGSRRIGGTTRTRSTDMRKWVLNVGILPSGHSQTGRVCIAFGSRCIATTLLRMFIRSILLRVSYLFSDANVSSRLLTLCWYGTTNPQRPKHFASLRRDELSLTESQGHRIGKRRLQLPPRRLSTLQQYLGSNQQVPLLLPTTPLGRLPFRTLLRQTAKRRSDHQLCSQYVPSNPMRPPHHTLRANVITSVRRLGNRRRLHHRHPNQIRPRPRQFRQNRGFSLREHLTANPDHTRRRQRQNEPRHFHDRQVAPAALQLHVRLPLVSFELERASRDLITTRYRQQPPSSDAPLIPSACADLSSPATALSKSSSSTQS
jgi:hypothetical protein